MLSKFKSAKHQQHLAQLPKLAQSADDVETLFHTRDFKGRLLAEIAGAKKTVYISALYIEHDDAGGISLTRCMPPKSQSGTGYQSLC